MATSLNTDYEPEDRYKAVVEHSKGLLVVSAGPGTGKTFSLLRRIEKLIEEHVNPNQIHYLTFVNSIVDAFKSDVSKPAEEGGLGVDTDELGIRVSTLHSMAFKIVKIYAYELQLPPRVEVVDLSYRPQSALSKTVVDDLFEYSKSTGVAETKRVFGQLLKKLTEAWRLGAKPDQEYQQLNHAVEVYCRKFCVCSWDQLVLLAIRAIEENGLPKWLQSAQHYLIDEYQDFNPAEQCFLDMITAPSDSVVIVGDPDQSIYSGRSASPMGLTRLLSREEVWSVNFVFCRRCPRKVVAAANRLLKFMDEANYPEKELQPFKDNDGLFLLAVKKSCKAEVDYIVELLRTQDESTYGDIIVLIAKRNMCEFYAKKFSAAGINCRVRVVDESAEALAAIMRLAILNKQPLLERLLLSHFQNLERRFKAQVLPLFLENSIPLSQTITQVSVDFNWKQPFIDSLSAYCEVVGKLTSNHTQSVEEALEALDLAAPEGAVEHLLETEETLSAHERVESSLGACAETVDGAANAENGIEITTMHSAKGLSRELVIIPAFEEKLLPGNGRGERLAEMHRLVYVAVTRAKTGLIITFPKRRAPRDPLNYGGGPKLSRYAKILIPPPQA